MLVSAGGCNCSGCCNIAAPALPPLPPVGGSSGAASTDEWKAGDVAGLIAGLLCALFLLALLLYLKDTRRLKVRSSWLRMLRPDDMQLITERASRGASRDGGGGIAFGHTPSTVKHKSDGEAPLVVGENTVVLVDGAALRRGGGGGDDDATGGDPAIAGAPGFNIDEYAQIKLLGRGGCGDAYLMRRTRDGNLCVCKHVSLEKAEATTYSARRSFSAAPGEGAERTASSSLVGVEAEELDHAEAISTEVAILASLHHPHIVRYLASSATRAEVRIFMEYAPGGSLDRAIQTQAKLKMGFSTGRVCTWVVQLADALDHVHSRRVLHRDLKTANVFLTHAGDVKLGDFGVARSFSTQTHLASTAVGTPYYMSPELINSQPYGEPSDVWSLGIILHELLTLKRPFDGTSLGAVVLNITNGQLDEAVLFRCKHDRRLCALASQLYMLHPDPTKRLTIEGLRVKILEWLWSEDTTEEQAEAVVDRLSQASSPRGERGERGERVSLGRVSRVDLRRTSLGSPSPRDSLPSLLWPSGEPVAGSAEAVTVAGLKAKRQSSAGGALALGLVSPGAAASGAGVVDEETGERRTSIYEDGGYEPAAARPRVPTVFEGAPTLTKDELVDALHEVGRIDAAELALGRRIGAGGFGSVFLAQWTPRERSGGAEAAGTRTVAVKVLTAASAAVIELCKEASLLCAARHANVVAVFGLSVGPDTSLSLVMEFCRGGSLFGLLHPDYGKESKADQARGAAGGGAEATGPAPALVLLEGLRVVRLMQDSAAGMAFLHSRGLIHRDLKSANLLLDAEHERCKVCDFGLSREAFLTAKMTRVGSVQWAAPEVLLGVAYGLRADVWSFGVVLWELCTGKVPFDGIPRPELARAVALEGLRLAPPKLDARRCPIQLLRLMAACFSSEHDRPQFHAIGTILEACEDTLRKAG